MIEHRESVSQITFKNAARYFKEQAFSKDIDDPEASRHLLARLSQRLYELSHYRV
jgi:hypothetical protein